MPSTAAQRGSPRPATRTRIAASTTGSSTYARSTPNTKGSSTGLAASSSATKQALDTAANTHRRRRCAAASLD